MALCLRCKEESCASRKELVVSTISLGWSLYSFFLCAILSFFILIPFSFFYIFIFLILWFLLPGTLVIGEVFQFIGSEDGSRPHGWRIVGGEVEDAREA
jgi:hypothetical protein